MRHGITQPTTVTTAQRTWTIGEPIAAGGYATIATAHCRDTSGVVKLIPKDPAAERELLVADDLGGVRNVMPVLDRGETEDYLTIFMPRAERSLSDYIKTFNQPILPQALLDVLMDISATLVDLDAKRIVHRDLKPANILRYRDSWCVTDFGIARYAEAATQENTRKDSMSPAYAAPEQWNRQTASTRTDIYALGVIAYELAAGRRPFTGPNLRTQHTQEQPPALTSTPIGIAAIIQHCLMKSPHSRPTAERLRSALLRQQADTETQGARSLLSANAQHLSTEASASVRDAANEERNRQAEALWTDAQQQFTVLAQSLRETVLSIASAATELPTRKSHGALSNPKFAIQLSGGILTLGSLRRSQANNLKFDVVAAAELRVEMLTPKNGYKGIAHALWYCDPKQAQEYAWHEVAFAPTDPHTHAGLAVTPHSSYPEDIPSEQAFNQVIGTSALAFPLTSINVISAHRFIDRWAGIFAQASQQALQRPNI